MAAHWNWPLSVSRCRAGSTKRSSVRPSVPVIDISSGVRRVCCWAPRVGYRSIAGVALSNNGAVQQRRSQQQMRAVPCWQPKDEAEQRLVNTLSHSSNVSNTLRFSRQPWMISSGAARGGKGEASPCEWTSKNYVICVCFHYHGTSSYHTTNTLQGSRANSHVDTQTIQPGLGDFVL